MKECEKKANETMVQREENLEREWRFGVEGFTRKVKSLIVFTPQQWTSLIMSVFEVSVHD